MNELKKEPMEKTRNQPAIVKDENSSQQVGEAQVDKTKAEPTVWTQRMLARLAKSESTTRWFRLWDKVISKDTLRAAFWGVWRNQGGPGVDGQRTDQFINQIEAELDCLEKELRGGTYQPLPALRSWIEKPGSSEKRPLGIPAVRDRTVQGALRLVVEPIWEQDFAPQSYGFRPGRGAGEAVGVVQELMRNGHHWVVDADLKSYFDTIDHNRLMEKVKRRIVDGSVLNLLEQFLKAGVMERMKGWKPTPKGTPQGAVISPLVANLYLNDLDHLMVERGWAMVRYADDFVVMCRSQEEAREALKFIQEWVEGEGLSLHPTKTRLVDASQESFDFLGWSIRLRGDRSVKWPRTKSVTKLKERLREMSPRKQGTSLPRMIAGLNRTLRGWHGYFREAPKPDLEKLDGWLRRRLRSMLKRSRGQRGLGKTEADHRRWPNLWFAKQGLFSLANGTCNYG
ncbi:MAG: group II intron reverse transcriptase/maturase [Planctomycetota bacterium]|nr:group II intron reverse transcriptase/maturase [Planctomycetota bacterium]